MRKEIIEVDEKNGIFRVTLPDERWYTMKSFDTKTSLPIYQYIPSVTWIAGHYPKGIGFYRWLAEKGWDESQALKNAAGDKGSKIHAAIECLIAGETVKMDGKFKNASTDQEEELSVEEYAALVSFASWADKVKPKFLHKEITAISKKHGYAGTVDCIAEINGEVFLVDWKSSQYVWPEYEIQVSAYKEALIEMGIIQDAKLAILQVGYKKNKAGYKWNDIEDKFQLFLHAKAIWENESSSQRPSQKDYPMEVKLTFETPTPVDAEQEKVKEEVKK